ncbi:MAG TPA: rod shape-determining protein [Symbiobacteriaceae bacterium]|jgi:rod shape-determining protein MreB
MFTQELGIDLGTANTVVVARRKGIVATEPSVVAVDRKTKSIVAVGAEARQMIGRTPDSIMSIRPVQAGVISDLNYSTTLLKYLIHGVSSSRWLRPRVILTMQSSASEVDRRTLAEAAVQAGAGEVYLMEQTVAAALGAGLPVAQATGSLLVDVGSGTICASVISLGGVVVSNSSGMAGDTLDEAIIRYVKREHSLLIGQPTAERLKLRLGSAVPGVSGSATVAGRLVTTGMPAAVLIKAGEVFEALNDSLAQVDSLVLNLLERTPPELLADISSSGITLTGGGALLRGLDLRLSQVTSLPVRVADSPMETVAMGTGQVLEGKQRVPLRRIKP